MRVLYNSLHNLDMFHDVPVRKAIPDDFHDYMEAYIQFATNENKLSREYNPIDENRTVLRCVMDILSNVLLQDDDVIESDEIDILADSIAKKLLDVEKLVQSRIGHLTDVQKGSIVQALLHYDETYKYVIAKVEHSEWYDGETLQKNFGFPGENKRVWKSAVLDLDIVEDSIVYKSIKVYVNHPAKYWSTEFLEVQESKTDSFNTRAVYGAIERSLKPIKNTSLRDYYNIKNTVIHELQSDQIINYPDMIGKLLDDYKPTSDTVNVTELKERLLAARERDGFDTQFHTEPEAIKGLGKIKIDVSPSVYVMVKEGIPNWEDEFFIYKKSDGRTYLMIRCDDQKALNSFPEEDG